MYIVYIVVFLDNLYFSYTMEDLKTWMYDDLCSILWSFGTLNADTVGIQQHDGFSNVLDVFCWLVLAVLMFHPTSDDCAVDSWDSWDGRLGKDAAPDDSIDLTETWHRSSSWRTESCFLPPVPPVPPSASGRDTETFARLVRWQF